MMQIMASERGGAVCTMDDRYCIDNGAMIAWPGLIQYLSTGQQATELKDSTFTQRFRTDEVEVTWRDD
jgi:N6-L-threonylcarbamoyladenine synthase